MTSQQRPPHEDIERNLETIAKFRAEGNDRLVLVTTTGRKSGRALTVPILYMGDGARPVVTVSNHCFDAPPAWYLNMLANPLVTVEDASETYETTAVTTTGTERERLLQQALTALPFVAEYQAKTTRRIELVALERRTP